MRNSSRHRFPRTSRYRNCSVLDGFDQGGIPSSFLEPLPRPWSRLSTCGRYSPWLFEKSEEINFWNTPLRHSGKADGDKMGGPGLPLVLCLLVAQPLVGWVPGLQSAHRPLPLWAGLAARASCRTCKQPASIAPSPLSRGRRAGRLRTCETFGGGVLFGTNGVALLAELGEGGAGEEGRDGDLGGGRRRRGRGTARKGLVVGESDAPDASAEDKAGAESEDDAGGFNPELIRQKTIQALDSMFAGCATPGPCDPSGPSQRAVTGSREDARFC